MDQYQTDLNIIANKAQEREQENEDFRLWLKKSDPEKIDIIVHSLNDKVSNVVDCTTCGNCCKTLIINVSPIDLYNCSLGLDMPETVFKDKYLEESLAGNLFMNTIPCNFLSNDKCTIYENRFNECREFPHLHKTGFQDRLLGTMLHYGRCPIIYNVIEGLKLETGFIEL